MALRDSAQPVTPGRFKPSGPAADVPFDPSQLTDAKAQIEYLVNTGRMSPEDANAALRPYGAKLDLQRSNRGRGPGGRDYYQVTGNHGFLREFVLPASLMVGAGVGINVLANALAAGATTAGYTAAAPNAVNAFTNAAVPSLANVGAAGSVPASISGATGVGLGAAPAVAAVPAAGTSIGTGVGFGAGGTPIAASAPAASTAANVAGTVASAAGGGLPFWGKALIGFGSDLFKTFMANRASGKANDELQKGIAQATGVYKDALGPYMNLGAGAAGSLGHLMGISPAAPGGAVPSVPTAGAPGNLASIGRQMPAGAEAIGTAAPRNMVDPAGAMGGGNLASVGTPQAPQNAPAMTRSSFVRMRAPDGEEDDVPFQFVPDALRRGAVEIGRG